MAAFVLRKVEGVLTLALIVCANMAAIAMTYSAEGGFMVPLEPLLVSLSAAMIAALAAQLLPRNRSW